MKRISVLLLVTFFALGSVNHSGANPSNCGYDDIESDLLSLSITNRRNESGEWVTWFSASKNSTSKANNMDVVLVRSTTSCRRNHFINIKGTIKDTSANEVNNQLFFHKKCSDNAAITNHGKTLQRIKENEYASALTHRPLMDDEVFTVRFDKRRNKENHALGIGVTTHSPDSIDLPNHMNTVKSGTWMFNHANLYHNSKELVSNVLKTPLNDIKIGQTIGIMKSKYGTLHFFIDGVDQGPVASKIPDTVYGVFQAYSDATQGTIIDS